MQELHCNSECRFLQKLIKSWPKFKPIFCVLSLISGNGYKWTSTSWQISGCSELLSNAECTRLQRNGIQSQRKAGLDWLHSRRSLQANPSLDTWGWFHSICQKVILLCMDDTTSAFRWELKYLKIIMWLKVHLRVWLRKIKNGVFQWGIFFGGGECWNLKSHSPRRILSWYFTQWAIMTVPHFSWISFPRRYEMPSLLLRCYLSGRNKPDRQIIAPSVAPRMVVGGLSEVGMVVGGLSEVRVQFPMWHAQAWVPFWRRQDTAIWEKWRGQEGSQIHQACWSRVLLDHLLLEAHPKLPACLATSFPVTWSKWFYQLVWCNYGL